MSPSLVQKGMIVFKNEPTKKKCVINSKTGWLVVTIINFLFGICGIVTCSLKLKYAQNQENLRESFFKLSIIFATCNVVLSVLLLVSVIKNSHRCSFVFAFLSFLSLFFAVIHIESSARGNISFLIVFIIIGILFFLWFCLFAAYQFLYQESLKRQVEMQMREEMMFGSYP